MEPQVHKFPGGWAATGDGFGAYAATRDEALAKYRQLQANRCRMPACDKRPVAEIEGVALCREHYDNFRTTRDHTPESQRHSLSPSDRTVSQQ